MDRTVVTTHYLVAFAPSRALGVAGDVAAVAASNEKEVACTFTLTAAKASALLPGEAVELSDGVVEIIIVAASEVVVLPAFGSLV